MYYSTPLYVEDIKKISDYTFPWEKLEKKKILITGDNQRNDRNGVSRCVDGNIIVHMIL